MSLIYDSSHPMPDRDLEYWVKEYATNSDFRDSVNMAARGAGKAVGYLYGKAASIGRHAAARIKQAVGLGGNKRQRVDVKTEEGHDPQNHDKFRNSKRPPIGASTVFAGGEVIERPLSLSIGKPVYVDVLKSFLQEFMGSRRYKCQFAVQYVGDDQTRSCQGMMFRHRIASTTTNLASRILKPTASFMQPTLNGASGVGTQITGLPYNFFDVSYQNNMKCMVSPLGMGNIEDICAALTPPCAASEYDVWSSTGSRLTGADVGLLTVPNYTAGLTPQPGSSWVADLFSRFSSASTEVARSPDVVVACRQGGVKLFFENKHPVGAYVEVIQYKVRREYAKGSFNPTFNSSGYDWVMDRLEQACGASYVDKVLKNKVPDMSTGRTPVKSDVTTNPYFPLLPKSSTSNSPNFHYFSERSRIRFAIASGAKRMVNVKFGGFKYDPLTCLGPTFDTSETVVLVIAVNGQMISAFAQAGSDQLVTGDAAAGHNMFIRGEYYEDLFPLKVSRPKTLFTYGEMQPKIPSVDTPGVSLSAYQILDARTQHRGNNITMEAGAVIDPTDGDDANDGIAA